MPLPPLTEGKAIVEVPVVTTRLIAEGSVDEYGENRKVAIADAFASLYAGVAREQITVTVLPGSVVIKVDIEFKDPAAAEAAQTSIASSMSSASAARSVLSAANVYVTSAPTVKKTSALRVVIAPPQLPLPSPPPPPPQVASGGDGAGGGGDGDEGVDEGGGGGAPSTSSPPPTPPINDLAQKQEVAEAGSNLTTIIIAVVAVVLALIFASVVFAKWRDAKKTGGTLTEVTVSKVNSPTASQPVSPKASRPTSPKPPTSPVLTSTQYDDNFPAGGATASAGQVAISVDASISTSVAGGRKAEERI